MLCLRVGWKWKSGCFVENWDPAVHWLTKPCLQTGVSSPEGGMDRQTRRGFLQLTQPCWGVCSQAAAVNLLEPLCVRCSLIPFLPPQPCVAWPGLTLPGQDWFCLGTPSSDLILACGGNHPVMVQWLTGLSGVPLSAFQPAFGDSCCIFVMPLRLAEPSLEEISALIKKFRGNSTMSKWGVLRWSFTLLFMAWSCASLSEGSLWVPEELQKGNTINNWSGFSWMWGDETKNHLRWSLSISCWFYFWHLFSPWLTSLFLVNFSILFF